MFISIAVVVLTVVIAFLSLGGNSGLPGNKTGTVDVVYPTTGRPSFSGTIDGTALTGKVTVKGGPVDLQLPTDDTQASDRKDTGF